MCHLLRVEANGDLELFVDGAELGSAVVWRAPRPELVDFVLALLIIGTRAVPLLAEPTSCWL